MYDFSHLAAACDRAARQAAAREAARTRIPSMASVEHVPAAYGMRAAAARAALAHGTKTEREIVAANGEAEKIAKHAVALAQRLGVVR